MKNKPIPQAWTIGNWAKGKGATNHCSENAVVKIRSLLTGRPIDSCLWRSDVIEAIGSDTTTITVFGNWLTIVDVDHAFSLNQAIDGPVPVVLLRHFVDPEWVESPEDLAALSATACDIFRLPSRQEGGKSEEEADEEAAHRAHLRKFNRNKILTGLCANFMRQIKAGDYQQCAATAQAEDAQLVLVSSCVAICQQVAGLYPTTIWPNNGAGAEPSAAQLGRSVACMIEQQIRALPSNPLSA